MFFDSSPTHHPLKSRLARLLTYSSTLRKAPFETKTTCFAHPCILVPLFGVLIWGFNAPVW